MKIIEIKQKKWCWLLFRHTQKERETENMRENNKNSEPNTGKRANKWESFHSRGDFINLYKYICILE